MSTTIDISVAMATFNGAEFLQAQLESIARQTRLPSELVINDDGSTDSTEGIVRAFAAEAPFPVRWERNESNLGSTANFDRAIGRCSGSHIALCDQDDVWLDEKLDVLGAAFESEPSIGLAFSDAVWVDESLNPIGDIPSLWSAVNLPKDLPDRLRREAGIMLVSIPIVTGATALFSKAALDLARPFPTDIPFWIHDRWAAAITAMAMPIAAIPKPLILYRRHSRQQIGVTTAAKPSVQLYLRSNRPMIETGLAAQRALAARLSERQQPIPGAIREYLEAREGHYLARLAIASGQGHAVGTVLSELLSGKYHRFSSGFRSAVKDLIERT